jgi:multiple sugar transport system ATP-binding protein
VAAIALERIERRFANGHVALRGVDLRVADGEFMVLVGPSGCGKSTLLRLIAGLDTPTAGRVLLDDLDVTGVAPQARDLAMVFQSYALYPHMTVRENLAYGLRVRGTRPGTIAERIDAVARALGIDALLDRRPVQLSGGQRQRVALGRALVREPKAFLFDEPLSNLDPALRTQARAELLRLHRQLGATVVYVTHDQEEALTLGHRVAVLREGRLEQLGPPLELYARPANTFVAQFIGAPPMNLLTDWSDRPGVPPDVVVGIRPQDVIIGKSEGRRATVDVVESRGHDAVVHLRVAANDGPLIVAVVHGTPPAVGTDVRVTLPEDRLHLFDADGTRRSN